MTQAKSDMIPGMPTMTGKLTRSNKRPMLNLIKGSLLSLRLR